MAESEQAEAERSRQDTRRGRRGGWSWPEPGGSELLGQHEYHCSPVAHLNFHPLTSLYFPLKIGSLALIQNIHLCPTF